MRELFVDNFAGGMCMSKLILDACCGSRMFWFDKANPNVEFVDCRECLIGKLIEDGVVWETEGL